MGRFSFLAGLVFLAFSGGLSLSCSPQVKPSAALRPFDRLPGTYFLPASDSVALPLIDLSSLQPYRFDGRARLRKAGDQGRPVYNAHQNLERQLLERRRGSLFPSGN